MILWNRSPGLGIAEDWFSTAQYFDVKTTHSGFEEVALAIGASYNLTGTGEPERVGTLRVSSNLLPMLGARPAVGRLFGPPDDVPGTTGTAVLGHSTWLRRYGGDPGAVGRAIVLNGQPYEIVGVLQEGFDVPREPLSQMMAWAPITVEGRTPAPGEAFITADIRVVGGDYFRAMEIPLLAGRLFSEHDTRGKDRVILVDEPLVQQLWPGQDPLGKRVRSGGFDATDAPWLTVVGVVGRIKQDRLDADSRIALYHPHTQSPTRAMNVTVRGRADAAHLSSAVSQGPRELGIRLALGATPRRVLGFVLRQGMVLALAGVSVGLAAAVALTRLMRSLLFGVGATDPLTFVAVPGLLVLVALGASYIPARRAAGIDPAVSLRSE